MPDYNHIMKNLLLDTHYEEVEDFLWNAYKTEFTLALLNDRIAISPKLFFNHRTSFWKEKLIKYMNENLQKAAHILIDDYKKWYARHTESGFVDDFFEEGIILEMISPKGTIQWGNNQDLGFFDFNIKNAVVDYLSKQDWYFNTVYEEINEYEELDNNQIVTDNEKSEIVRDALDNYDWEGIVQTLDYFGETENVLKYVIKNDMYPAWRQFWAGLIEEPEENVAKSIEMMETALSSQDVGKLSSAVNFALQVQHVHGSMTEHSGISMNTLHQLSNMDSKQNITEINEFLDMITGVNWNEQNNTNKPKYASADLQTFIKMCESDNFKLWLLGFIKKRMPGFLAGISIPLISAWGLWNSLPADVKQQASQEYNQKNEEVTLRQEPDINTPAPAHIETKKPVVNKNISRGIRNNNPGNIDKGQKWQGLAQDQTDSRFATFDSPESGIRAMAIVIKNYQKKYKINDINGIIKRWAPPNENKTSNYITSVCKSTGFKPDQQLNLSDPEILFPIIKAIINHENGSNPYSDEIIMKGIKKASFISWKYKFAIKQDKND